MAGADSDDDEGDDVKFFDSWFDAFLALAATSALGGLMALLFFAFRADGAVVHCYLETRTPEGIPHATYLLHGYRPWRTDTQMGMFDSFEQAADAAERVKCPLVK